MISKIIQGDGDHDTDTLLDFSANLSEVLKGYNLIHLTELVFTRQRYADSHFDRTTIVAVAVLEEK